jgi:hypothetical protein
MPAISIWLLAAMRTAVSSEASESLHVLSSKRKRVNWLLLHATGLHLIGKKHVQMRFSISVKKASFFNTA